MLSFSSIHLLVRILSYSIDLNLLAQASPDPVKGGHYMLRKATARNRTAVLNRQTVLLTLQFIKSASDYGGWFEIVFFSVINGSLYRMITASKEARFKVALVL